MRVRAFIGHNSVRLDLDENFGRDQAADLDHAGGWADVPEEFAVCPPHLVPLVDVDNVLADGETGFFDAADAAHLNAKPRRRFHVLLIL
jgi:hypothetical protein